MERTIKVRDQRPGEIAARKPLDVPEHFIRRILNEVAATAPANVILVTVDVTITAYEVIDTGPLPPRLTGIRTCEVCEGEFPAGQPIPPHESNGEPCPGGEPDPDDGEPAPGSNPGPTASPDPGPPSDTVPGSSPRQEGRNRPGSALQTPPGTVSRFCRVCGATVQVSNRAGAIGKHAAPDGSPCNGRRIPGQPYKTRAPRPLHPITAEDRPLHDSGDSSEEDDDLSDIEAISGPKPNPVTDPKPGPGERVCVRCRQAVKVIKSKTDGKYRLDVHAAGPDDIETGEEDVECPGSWTRVMPPLDPLPVKPG